MVDKDYIVVVQCHIVKQRCSGFLCENAFHHRLGGFADYPSDAPIRTIHMTCGGCCGRAVHRKLTNLVNQLKKRDGVARDRVVVQLSSCISKDSYHGPKCPNLEYLKTLVGRLKLDIAEDTVISNTSVERRRAGVYDA